MTGSTLEQAFRSSKRPVKHPGLILKTYYFSPLNIRLREFAGALRVSENTASRLLNGRSRISVSTALKLSKLFGTSAEYWLNLQNKYDLWHERQKLDLEQYKPLAAANKA